MWKQKEKQLGISKSQILVIILCRSEWQSNKLRSLRSRGPSRPAAVTAAALSLAAILFIYTLWDHLNHSQNPTNVWKRRCSQRRRRPIGGRHGAAGSVWQYFRRVVSLIIKCHKNTFATYCRPSGSSPWRLHLLKVTVTGCVYNTVFYGVHKRQVEEATAPSCCIVFLVLSTESNWNSKFFIACLHFNLICAQILYQNVFLSVYQSVY